MNAINEELMFEKINNLKDNQDKLGSTMDKMQKFIVDKLDNIETVLTTVAVQKERIGNLESKVTAMYSKVEKATGPDSSLVTHVELKELKDEFKSSTKRHWVVIGAFGTVILMLAGFIFDHLNQVP